MPAKTEDYTLMVPQVAKMLKRTERTIREYARRGILPAVKIGRDWFFLPAAIEKKLTPSK